MEYPTSAQKPAHASTTARRMVDGCRASIPSSTRLPSRVASAVTANVAKEGAA